jgi:putative transposase
MARRLSASRHGFRITANRLERNFIATAPTESGSPTLPTPKPVRAGFVRAAAMELYSRKIVGSAMADHLRVEPP